MAVSSILLLCLSTLLATTFAQTCYNPDGSVLDATTYSPCFPSLGTTHCCALGATCLSNGLCLSKWDTSLNTGGCTDSAWADPACFLKCAADKLGEISTLYRCNNYHWCCSAGGNTTSCCDDPQAKLFLIDRHALVQNGTAFVQGYNIAADADIVDSDSASVSSTVVTGTQSISVVVATVPVTATSGAVLTAATSTSTPSCSSNAALTAGLGAGLGVGIPLLAVIGVLSFLLFRNRKKRSAPFEKGNDSGTNIVSHKQTPIEPSMMSPNSIHSPYSTYSSQTPMSPTHAMMNPITPAGHRSVEADAGPGRTIHEISSKSKRNSQIPELPAYPG